MKASIVVLVLVFLLSCNERPGTTVLTEKIDSAMQLSQQYSIAMDMNSHGDTVCLPIPIIEPKVDIEQIEKNLVIPSFCNWKWNRGKILVSILIGRDGKPKKCRIDSSDIKMLNGAVVNAIMKSTFTPSPDTKGADDYWVTIPITFNMR